MNNVCDDINLSLSSAVFSKISIVYLPLSFIKILSRSRIFLPTPNGSTIGINSPLVIRSSFTPFILTSNFVGFTISSIVTTIDICLIGIGNIG